MKKHTHKWTMNIAQVLVGCLLAWLGHPYVGIAIAAVHF